MGGRAVAAIGLDVGGTKILGVALDDAGEVVAEERRPTPRGAEAIAEDLAAVAEVLGAADPDVPMGVGMPGLITHDGLLAMSPNLPNVVRFDVRGVVGDRLGRPVTVTNDATAATFAEWQVGAGRGVDDLVMVTLGTGIGGGIVAGGRLLTGAHGFAGEFGHMVVDVDGLPCPCGRAGCWERYASGSGLANLARLMAVAGRLPDVVERAGGEADDVRGEHVYDAAAAGDDAALGVIDDFARWVALGLSHLTNALDPARFVLGGGLAEGADLYLGPIERWYHELLFAGDLRPVPAVRFAELGERAGAIGAARYGARPAE